MDMVFYDLNGDGLKEILLAGINNEYLKGCLIVLDPRNMEGGSPQMIEKYKCTELKKGTEKYYLLLPRTDVDLLINFTGAANTINISKNSRLSVMTLYSKLIYEFNPSLKIQDVRKSFKFEFMHQNFLREGKVKSKLDNQYIKNLKSGILYYNGQEWTKEHFMSNSWETVGGAFKGSNSNVSF
ncbi:unnamed protein product [marine sediment metagenome]|uniref:Uncharacterized protein n=1 Tax=marine sediment metagenome TaxID=412755 RepID=X1REK9_9ZZZZ